MVKNTGVKQKGFGIIEVMIAGILGLFLVLGIAALYKNTLQSSRVQEALSRVHENGRVAIELLSRDVREAGYMGCMGIEALVPNVIALAPPSVEFTLSNALFGFTRVSASQWLPSPDAYTGNELSATFFTNDLANAKVGSDVLVVQKASGNGVPLTGNMTADNANIQVDGNPYGFEADDVLIVSDCESADVFKATSVSSAAGQVTIAHASSTNTSNKLSKPYLSNSTTNVSKFMQSTYFVQDSGRNNFAGEDIYSLYKRDHAGTIVELIEGVEYLKVLYGEDTDSDGEVNRYLSTEDATINFENVVAVRIGVLLTANENTSLQVDQRDHNVAGEVISYEGDEGATVHEGGRRIRKAYNTTIRLRNRGLE